MFKTIKWYAFICTIILLFTGEMAQAMFNGIDDDEPMDVDVRKSRYFEVGSTEIKESSQASGNAFATQRSIAISQVEQQVSGWDFTYFNWGELLPYVSQYMSLADFMEATQAGYASITNLAKLILKKQDAAAKTLIDAKFLVYSAFSTLYSYRVENSLTTLSGFNLISNINTVMRPHKANSVLAYPVKLSGDYMNAALSTYEYNFTANSAITRLTLNNDLIDLVTLINKTAGVRSAYVPSLIAPIDAERPPTFAELVQYYPGEEKRILVFLVNYPLELKKVRKNSQVMLMQDEKQFKSKVAESFKTLWQHAQNDDSLEDLAKISLALFGCNLLNISTPASHGVRVLPPVASSTPSVDWKNLCGGHAHDVVTAYYSLLSDTLNAGDLCPHLLSARVISSYDEQRIKLPMNTKSEQNHILIGSVMRTLGHGSNYFNTLKNMLEVMKKYGTIAEQSLVDRIYANLADPSLELPGI